MLSGTQVFPLKRFPDERGSFGEIIRSDWSELLGGDQIVQANLSVTFPGVVRAWHRHSRGQVDYFVVLDGTVKICAFDDESRELDEVVCSGEIPQVVRIPGRYWHGFKVIAPKVAKVLYFVNMLYDHSDPDEQRKTWDEKLVPASINGKKDDPRVGRPWNWYESPNK